MSERVRQAQFSRRRLIKFAGASLLLSVRPLALASPHSTGILAVRIWPAADYTRVTIEHGAPLKYTYLTVKDPERLVVDLEGIEFNSVLETLSNKVTSDDPNIKRVRAGRYKPGVVRLVMELKGEAKPQVFELAPVGRYGHRLVLDVYPASPPDPLLALLEGKQPAAPVETRPAGKSEARSEIPSEVKTETRVESNAEVRSDSQTEAKNEPQSTVAHQNQTANKRPGRAIVDRLVTITLDPGHGGEDPGAIGAGGSQEKSV
ncbi:MAG TPA: AMIN domain-containing protein, partial [Accumulibacter sp.]|nr:AMIN domain-containing protein [Accumulibacter sp.]